MPHGLKAEFGNHDMKSQFDPYNSNLLRYHSCFFAHFFHVCFIYEGEPFELFRGLLFSPFVISIVSSCEGLHVHMCSSGISMCYV